MFYYYAAEELAARRVAEQEARKERAKPRCKSCKQLMKGHNKNICRLLVERANTTNEDSAT